jgi:hypothetical protein
MGSIATHYRRLKQRLVLLWQELGKRRGKAVRTVIVTGSVVEALMRFLAFLHWLLNGHPFP